MNPEMQDQNQQLQEDLYEQATRWWLRVEAAPADAALGSALEQWLAASESRRMAYARVSGLMYGLLQLEPEAPTPAPSPAAPRSWRPAIKLWASAGASLGMLVLGLVWLFAPNGWQNLRADAYTVAGEVRVQSLADGSVLTLDSDTAVRIELGPAQRELRLLRGALHVRVAPDANRPLSVYSGTLRATALGTAYSVDHDTAEVAVNHGMVQVKSGQSQVMLSAGEAARPSPTGWSVVSATTQSPDWTRGQRVFEQQPLREVLERLDRYLPGRLWLPDAAVLAQPVTAVLDLRDPQRALALLCAAHGLQVRQWPGLIVISQQ